MTISVTANAVANYSELSQIQRQFEAHRWIYAKTMPQNPHFYTLRRDWAREAGGDEAFVEVVKFIRACGHDDPFGGRIYRALDLNGFHYWTMGAPLDETILINRKEIRRYAEYDGIAPLYDGWWNGEDARIETEEVLKLLGYRGGSVLDVGCGTGLFLDFHPFAASDYLGLDPSMEMLYRLQGKHPGAAVRPWTFEEFAGHPAPGQKFDVIVSLFGAAAYIEPHALARIPQMLSPGGRFFLMFYAPGYVPQSDRLSGTFLKHFGDAWHCTLRAERLSWGNYVIAQGGAECATS
jgi:hypothetical protein